MAGADTVKTSDLPVRLLSAAVMLTVLIGAMLAGGVWFQALVAVVGGVTLFEFVRLVLRATGSMVWRAAGIVFAFAYVGSAAWLLANMSPYFMLAVLGSVIFTDTGAYFTGRAIGGPKMAPSISPSKTWAGLLGGMFFAGLFLVGMVAVYYYIAGFTTPADIIDIAAFDMLGAMLAGAVLAVAAQAGDFFESWLKRKAGVKDSSHLIPGHGGVFDRTDGLLPVALIVGAVASMAY